MSTRRIDYFAGVALQQLLQFSAYKKSLDLGCEYPEEYLKVMCKEAFKIADAMEMEASKRDLEQD
jgi:hypothetical protein